MARIVVTGATGTIGSALCGALASRGDQPVALSRSPDAARAALPEGTEIREWADPTSAPPAPDAVRGAAGVINLIGEPISQRWTAEAKQRIRDSRVLCTRMLVSALTDLDESERPAVLVSQSATGYYGARGDEQLDEQAPAGTGWLADLVRDWEAQAMSASTFARVVVTRTGVVLSASGGALEKMLPFFRAGVGGPVAGGKQFVPWIHLDDVVSGLLFCLDNEGTTGAANLTAPTPVSNTALSKALGRALHRPAVLPVPGFALKLLYGEMSQIVTSGQRVLPHQLTTQGYGFAFEDIDAALTDVL
jgi:uncharacterized protein (TIGR01777 family)